MKKTRAKRETTLRTETLSVRMDPKLRYLAKVAAQKQRRPISSFVEWAVEKALGLVEIAPGPSTIADYAYFLWDVDEVDRFIKLAFVFEELLNHEEQVVWKVIKSSRYFWTHEPMWPIPVFSVNRSGGTVSRTTGTGSSAPSPDPAKIKKHWSQILAVAHGKAPAESLPAATPESPTQVEVR